MDMKELAIRFTGTAEDEINALVTDLQLAQIASFLQTNDQPLPDQLKSMLVTLLGNLVDLFSMNLPEISANPEETLRTVSRDINLSRVMRERGLFRLYRLLHQTDESNLPLFMSLINPDTGSPFAKQEEFITWFCREAHVARSLVFIRMATIDRTMALGFDLEKTFQLVISKPYAIRETLNMIGKWNKGELIGVDPDVVLQVAGRVAPEMVDKLRVLAEDAAQTDDQSIRDMLTDASKPVLARLLQEVAEHDRAKDALDMVRHDILLKPEISYAWDEEQGALMVHLVRKSVDPKTGAELAVPEVVIPFVPDSLELPTEIKADLLKRLPIRNRFNLDEI